MFETYIINLKRDIQRYYTLRNKLVKRGIIPYRFDAIYGKDIKNFDKYKKYITTYCQYFCPRGLIGCGLSHYNVLDIIYKKYKQLKNTEYSLVLEDDAIPLFHHKNDIEKIIKNIPKDCDILLLYCQGQCGYDYVNASDLYMRQSSIFTGSAVAYIIRNSSIPKFLKSKLINHVDIQWYNTPGINVYIYGKEQFNVNKDSSYNYDVEQKNNVILNQLDDIITFDNTTVSESVLYNIFRIPYVNIDITFYDILKFIIYIIIIYFVWRYMIR